MTVTVFRYLIFMGIDFYHFISPFYSLLLVSVEKIYQTLKTAFDRISNHLKVRQKYSTACHIFNSLLVAWTEMWSNTVFNSLMLLNLGVI